MSSLSLVVFYLVLLNVCIVETQAQRIRLVNSVGSQVEGRLEVEFGNQWFAVCSGNLVATLGDWVCAQLGIGSFVSTGNFGNAAESAIVTFSCGATATLDQCTRSGVDTTCAQGGLICSARECIVSQWSSWSDCSAMCDSGTQNRVRQVTQLPTNGFTCPPLNMTQICNTQFCNGSSSTASTSETTTVSSIASTSQDTSAVTSSTVDTASPSGTSSPDSTFQTTTISSIASTSQTSSAVVSSTGDDARSAAEVHYIPMSLMVGCLLLALGTTY